MRSTQSLQLAKTALAALSVAGLLASAPAFAVPSMNIQVDGGGPNGTIATGETVTVSLYGNDIPVGGGAPNDGLFGFGFAITFNDSILDSSAAIAGPLWVGTGFDDSRNDPGDVGMTANRFFMADGPDGDDILLASIDFTGLTVGLASLSVGYYTLGSGDNILFDGTVLDGSPNFFESGLIEVIPEPQTALLLGLGLTLFATRRASARQQATRPAA